MISIEQCRAARGLLGWTQQDLADASGLSKTAINNFEKGNSDIKAESLRAVRMAFESAEIEFLDQDGIRKRTESSRLFKGLVGIQEILEDIIKNAQEWGYELLSFYFWETIQNKAPPQLLMDLENMLEKQNLKQKSITQGIARLSPHTDSDERILKIESEESITPYLILGEKVALEVADNIYVLIQSRETSDALRGKFEKLWESAKETAIEKSKASA